ncbi:CHAP domain-containing protein [Nonomuraea sp. NPDC049695]|uniref:CHAP domain-containing protein n=1 Tax=Nonomuraea sp. NPDC049695 TaxID=3154734 RepID=UPI003438F911
MTPEIQKFIELLESQIGYSEKADDYTKFGDWYGKHVEFDADYSSAPWCDMYLSWAAHKLGYQDWIGQFAWTVSHAKWFKKQGAWGHKPKPGAIVFYDWSGSNDIDKIDHVGIVTRVEGDTIHTIEGNIDGGVAKRKERDTSKVVGYGYPDRVKSRLDEEAAQQAREAQKKAEEQTALKSGPGTDVGTLQLPGNESLTSLIPQNQIITQNPVEEEPAKAPVTGSSPAKKSPQTAPTPAPKVTTGTATDGKAAETLKQQPKKAKHAKPATADTTAATAKPLPTHTDASATGPLPSISSPTLVGTTLVAALALLAVAKTRRLRMAPVAAGSTAPRSNTNRRRRRTATTTATPVRASLRLDSTQDAPLRTAALDAITLDTAQLTTATAAVELAATSSTVSSAVRRIAAQDARHVTDIDVAAQNARHLTDSDVFRRITVSGTQGSDGSEAFGRTAATRGARHRRRPLDTRPFDLAIDAAPRDITATGPIEIVLDTGPLERIVDTGPFERIVIPGATSAFDAFAPTGGIGGRMGGGMGGDVLDTPDIGATYRGRRRRREHPVEDTAAFATDQPLRGRRHRRPSAAPQGVHVGGAQELTGRRHATTPLPPRRDDDRELVGVGTSAGSQAAAAQPTRSAAPQPGGSATGHAARSAQGQPRRRGRHRA